MRRFFRFLRGGSATGLLAAAVLAGILSSRAVAAGPSGRLVAFGDSLTDVGNLYTLDGGLYPSPSLGYTKGMFTDGPDTTPSTTIVGNFAYQLNSALGYATLSPSLAGGTDYAYGGADSGSNVVVTLSPTVSLTIPGMTAQVDSYLNANTTAGVTAIPSNNIYLLWGGANDILNAAETSGATAAGIDSAAANAATNVYGEIDTLYQNGGRNFIWLNIPNLGLTPEGAALSTSADLPTASADFNSSFSQYLQVILNNGGSAGLFPGIKLDAIDVNTLFNQVIASPSTYGFTNVTGSSQGLSGVNPNDYLFWDGLHPTTAADKYFLNQTLAGINATFATPEPASVWMLGAGLVLLGVWRRRSAKGDAEGGG